MASNPKPPRNPKWKNDFEKRLETLRADSRLRSPATYDMMIPGRIQAGEVLWLNLSANDYLGLARDPRTLSEAELLGGILPPGAGASRLITGSLAIHRELEKLLAEWKGTEAALVYPSGYQANVGLLTALAGRGDAIYSDKLNHASIVDGCQMSGAAFHRYRHGDMNELESLLSGKKPRGNRFIVTDGVFSMDGDLAPLDRLNRLAKKYRAPLVVDEAHATGVVGAGGRGAWEHFGLPLDEHVILMGTLSKAIGAQGGFVCASRLVIDLLINTSRPFIYSTALSPLLAGLAHFNIARIRDEPELLERLRENIRVFRGALRENGMEVSDDPTPIVPLMAGESAAALEWAARLRDEGIAAVAIRPPTVPEGTARLRCSASAAHNPAELREAAVAIAKTRSKSS